MPWPYLRGVNEYIIESYGQNRTIVDMSSDVGFDDLLSSSVT